ncbi:uncharacterized protein LOC132554445 [Ylistrum balloti]|uniref:uncharacterized protein LOC132554445 n=1 Tax=Ylistrum balloti TaxID=509963 RepID=UPI0029058674|nr:uncharacterized protein LOC132554445 [Ylistrum balloti]
MGFIIMFGVVVTLSVMLREANAVKCFTCDRMAYPRDCPFIAECGPHEECYLRKYETVDGHAFFSSGCRDRLMCSAPGRRDVMSDVVERSNFGQEVLVCQECCDTDHCNYGGCGEPGFPPRGSRGPICYNCKQQQTDSSCNEVAVCGRDQACFVQVAYDVIYDHVYNSYCGTVDLCQRITMVGRKRALPVHCCTDDLCISGFNSTHIQTKAPAASTVATPAATPAATVAPVTTAAPPPTNATVLRCPPITSQFRNSCYYFSTEVKYWSQGQQICIARGGNLASIDDKDENDFIVSKLKQMIANGEIPSTIWGYYFGAHIVNGHWVKPDGTSLTFTNWGPGEPDLPISQHYGLIFLPGQYVGNYLWGSNADIDGVERYICEIKLH